MAVKIKQVEYFCQNKEDNEKLDTLVSEFIHNLKKQGDIKVEVREYLGDSNEERAKNYLKKIGKSNL